MTGCPEGVIFFVHTFTRTRKNFFFLTFPIFFNFDLKTTFNYYILFSGNCRFFVCIFRNGNLKHTIYSMKQIYFNGENYGSMFLSQKPMIVTMLTPSVRLRHCRSSVLTSPLIWFSISLNFLILLCLLYI